MPRNYLQRKAPKLAAKSIPSNRLLGVAGTKVTGTIPPATIPDHSIADVKMVANTLTAASIAPKTITAAQVADHTLGDLEVTAKGITNASVADHTLADLQVVAKGISSASIADHTLGDQQITALGVTGASIANTTIADGKMVAKTLTNASIANGTVNQALLENFLRSTCKYVVAADQTLTMGAAVSFATKIVDPFSPATPQVTGTAITPIATGLLNWKIALRLTGGDVNAGRAAHIIITDTTFGSIIAAGQECGGFTDEYGTDVIVARFDEAVSVIAGHTYNVSFILLTKTPGSYVGVSWVGTATVKTFTTVTYTNVSTGTPSTYNVSGSFLQLEPRAQ